MNSDDGTLQFWAEVEELAFYLMVVSVFLSLSVRYGSILVLMLQ